MKHDERLQMCAHWCNVTAGILAEETEAERRGVTNSSSKSPYPRTGSRPTVKPGPYTHCLRAVKHLSTFSRWLGDVYDVQVCKCNWQHIISVCSLWPGSKGELLAHSAAVKHLLLDSFNGRPSHSHRSRYESATRSCCCSFRRAAPLPIHKLFFGHLSITLDPNTVSSKKVVLPYLF